MNRTLLVALREFVSTVGTKGFIIGTLVFPAIMIVAIVLVPRLIDDKPPRYVGEIAVIDRSGWQDPQGRTLVDVLRQAYAPETLAAEFEAQKKGVRAQVEQQLGEAGAIAAEQVLEKQLGELPEIRVVALPEDADIEQEKQKLLEGSPFEGGRLALIVIEPNAVVPGVPEPAESAGSSERGTDGETVAQEAAPGQDEADARGGEAGEDAGAPSEAAYGSFRAFIRAHLDDRFQDPLRRKLTEAIRSARIQAAGEDARRLAALMHVQAPRFREVTETGERESAGGELGIFVAMGFMMLLWISVMTGGQYLMTTVITEKSNRVMEVLLSAISPRQLMTGKIIGQMGVALSILAIYLTIGVVALDRFNYLDLVKASSLGLVVVYFFIAFFLFAALMAAIGSAVTEVTEAQSLLTPVMMILIIPWILFVPLTRNPNSTFATVMGLIPPISPFAMVIREAGTDPVPMWQHTAAIVIGVVSVLVAIWAAAKIFRIGVLMYGKPPNFKTLLRWVRMA